MKIFDSVLALINELQVQDSSGSHYELSTPTLSKTEMVCNLAQLPPEIWMTLPVEAKKWLLNEQKLQQQHDDNKKRSSSSDTKDTTKVADRGKKIPIYQKNKQKSKIL
jgi:hypothetical protein